MSAVLIIDVPNHVVRDWHASHSDTADRFMSRFRAMRTHLQPSDVIAAFESYGGEALGWRHTLYAAYKSTRKPLDNSIRLAIFDAMDELTKEGVVCRSREGFEADDIIASGTRVAVNAGLDVTISSGDRDFYQLLGPRVKILSKYTRERGERPAPTWVTAESMESDTGLHPSQWVDYTMIVGGKNDVPGLDGVGPKAATLILKAYGTLAEAKEDGAQWKVNLNARQSESIRKMSFDWYEMATKLTTLRDDLDIGWEPTAKGQHELQRDSSS